MRYELYDKTNGRKLDENWYVGPDGLIYHNYDNHACGDDECCGPNESGTHLADDSWEGGCIRQEDIEIRMIGLTPA